MTVSRSIGLLIVDDSALIRSILKQSFQADPDISILGEASNGEVGCRLNLELKPDAVVMDINMPIMDGLTATRKMMAERRVPIMVFSSAVDAKVSFEAMSAGAVDVVPKPDIDQLGSRDFLAGFKSKLKAAIESPAFAHRVGRETADSRFRKYCGGLPDALNAIVIGASTGGPLAVREVLAGLPSTLPVGIAIVQHLEEGFDQGYVLWLDEATPLKVRLATGNERLTGGEVVVAPVNRHLAVNSGRLVLDDRPRVLNQKPAVDVLFETAAACFRERLLGVLLTGMGRDGADGCRRIIDNGGYTLVQDRESSAIFGMPKAAIEAGAASEVLGLSAISQRILTLLNIRTSS
jgi:chemotaxis response regulator CheB